MQTSGYMRGRMMENPVCAIDNDKRCIKSVYIHIFNMALMLAQCNYVGLFEFGFAGMGCGVVYLTPVL